MSARGPLACLDDWWLLALDTALNGDIDAAQLRYFGRVASERMGPDDAAIVVTHAHIDHCGRLAMATELGFRGKIYCTTATHELLGKVELEHEPRNNRVRVK